MPRLRYRVITQGGKTKPRKITFDDNRGIGAVSSSGSFVRMMRPSQFLLLANPLDVSNPDSVRYSKVNHIVRQLKKGANYDTTRANNPPNRMGLPFLNTKWNERHGAWEVTGHEGRHRSVYLAKRGNPLIPVKIIPNYNPVERTPEGRMQSIPRVNVKPFIPEGHLETGRGSFMGPEYIEYRRNLRRGLFDPKRDKFLIKLPTYNGPTR